MRRRGGARNLRRYRRLLCLRCLRDPLGPEATADTDRLAGRTVQLAPGADKYGRSLAYVVGWRGEDQGLRLIRAGLARAADYGHDHPRRVRYEAAQDRAQAAQAGMWATTTADDVDVAW